jgi:hypothetical protein
MMGELAKKLKRLHPGGVKKHDVKGRYSKVLT